MSSHMPRFAGYSLQMFALAIGISIAASSPVLAQSAPAMPSMPPTAPTIPPPPAYNGTMGVGTLGYGPPGPQPGWQGFGLGYHLGYGYGGDALGPGAEGGYPFYGGPGYPHPAPCLKRFGHTEMFPYFGGPGHPTPENPNFFGTVGPLAADAPVVTIGGSAGYDSGYGSYTGVLPYPESTFAPYTTAAGGEGVASGVSTSTPYAPNLAPPGRLIGIETQGAAEPGKPRGLKIFQIYPGSPAAKAGLHAGDVIESVNGYETEQPGNLAWIIANAAPDRVLSMNVRTVIDGKVTTIRVQFP